MSANLKLRFAAYLRSKKKFMPKSTIGNKSAIKRYAQIVHYLLNERENLLTKKYFINEIYCSKRTFEEDLSVLRNDFNLKIKTKKNIYSLDKNDLPKNLLAKSDLTEICSFILAQQLSTLSNNNSLENKKKFTELILGLPPSEINYDIDDCILPEEPVKIEGLKWFEEILRAIHLGDNLNITFKHPYREDEAIIMLPLSLKQFQFRWYVICIDAKENVIRVALNWIINIQQVKKNKIKRPNQDSFVKNYYKDVIGLIKEGDVEEVVLKFSKQQYKYIESIPIHESQKEIAKDNKTVTVKLNVVPNYELEMKILAWNVEVEILKPDSLKQKIIERLQNNLEKYL